MEVSLTPDLREFVGECVASGTYESADEVIWEALSLLREQQSHEAKRATLRVAIQEGIDSIERGEGVSGEEFFAARQSGRTADRAG